MYRTACHYVCHYAYRTAMGVLAASVALVLFSQGIMPSGLTAAATNAGSALLVVHPGALFDTGARIAVPDGSALVTAYTAGAAERHDGVLYYAVDGAAPVAARDVSGTVVATVPLLGAWERVLLTPVGLMAFVGVPFIMLALEILLVLGASVRWLPARVHAAARALLGMAGRMRSASDTRGAPVAGQMPRSSDGLSVPRAPRARQPERSYIDITVPRYSV
jgi:hypothetical protein